MQEKGDTNKYNNMTPGAADYVNHYVCDKVNENGDYLDGKHYLDTDDPNVTKDYFNFL